MTNELSEYLTLKYDIEHNHITTPNKVKRYNELKTKIEKQEEEKKRKKAESEKQFKELAELKKDLFKNNTLKSAFYPDDTYYLHDYHPKNIWKDGVKIPNPLKDNITKFIIDIKNCDSNAINKIVATFTQLLFNLNKFTICIVPPSNSLKETSGIKIIAKLLSQNGAIDGTDCIKRKYTIPSQHLSSERLSTPELKASLTIEKEELIKDRNILLLDDLITRGNSFESSKELLLEKGAKSVICIALAKTSFDHNL